MQIYFARILAFNFITKVLILRFHFISTRYLPSLGSEVLF